mmetsp:Transcript_11395/g.20607  ORF Transcript_11395/g.20607 Transcript_11395/m.20607 type:complete len:100 (-) Transcript_11395:145-444(-)
MAQRSSWDGAEQEEGGSRLAVTGRRRLEEGSGRVEEEEVAVVAVVGSRDAEEDTDARTEEEEGNSVVVVGDGDGTVVVVQECSSVEEDQVEETHRIRGP